MILFTYSSRTVGASDCNILPSGSAHDAQPLILGQNRVELELKELGGVPDEGEDLPNTVIHGRHSCKEGHDSPRDRLCSLYECHEQGLHKVEGKNRVNLQVIKSRRG
jgi:hypothetical protein